jgi:hypothetical protein
MKINAAVILGALTFAALGTHSAHASLIGDTVSVRFLYPDAATTLHDHGTFTITGTESFADGGAVSIAFGSSTITLTNLVPGAFASVPFLGYDIQLISGAPFSNVVIDPLSSSAFATGTVLTFSSNDIKINFAATCGSCAGGETIVLNLTDVTAAVPEPSTWAMMILGFAGVGFMAYRRSRKDQSLALGAA